MCKYLSIFDVRGIQDFIFRSKSIEEIVGASALVEDIVIECFEQSVIEVIQNTNQDSSKVLFDWKNEQEVEKIDDSIKSDLICEVLYNGGGNLFVLFDKKDDFNKVSRAMAIHLYNNAYGICVVSACVDASEDFDADRTKLMSKLADIKASTLAFTPTLSYSITNNDRYNGLPYEVLDNKGNKISKEKAIKLRKFNDEKVKSNLSVSTYGLTNQDEDDSNIAIIHIDGNGVGQAIIDGMENCKDYKEAIATMRKISLNLSEVFKAIDKDLNKELKSYNKKVFGDDSKHYLKVRKLILAGDDMTYMCNPKIAIDIVRIYADVMAKKYSKERGNDNPLGKLSVCAGIVFCKRSFPFYKAYELAEELCSMSKKHAKSDKAKEINDSNIGSYFDYEYIKSGFSNSVELYRDKNNANLNENKINLYNRPFALGGKDTAKSFDTFAKAFDDIKPKSEDHNDKKSIARSWLKRLREIQMGRKSDFDEFEKEAKSRGYNFSMPLLQDDVQGKFNNANYFAPLDLMDLYSGDFYSFYNKK